MKLEKDIERSLVRITEKHGGRCMKWVCPGFAGVPDRILLFPGGHLIFIETKRPGGKIRPLQEWWCKELRRLGFLYFYIYDEEGLQMLADFMRVWAAEGFKE